MADRLVDDDGTAATFSLRVVEQHRQERRQDLHLLYHGHHVVARSRGVARLVQVLLAHLAAWDRAGRTDLLKLHVGGFVQGASAVLVPFSLRLRLEARLAAQGFRSVDGPWVSIDPHTAELVVDRPALALDPGARQALADRRPPTSRDLQPGEAGRYDVALWAMGDDAADGPSGPGLNLLNAAKVLVGAGPSDAAPTLQAVARLLQSTPVVPAYPLEDLMAATRRVASLRRS